MTALSALARGDKPRPRGLFAFRCGNSNLATSLDVDDARREEQEVQELARVLVKSWAEGFDGVKEEVPLFTDTYDALVAKGIGFPELRDEERTVLEVRSPEEEEAQAVKARADLLIEVLGSEERDAEVVGELVTELERSKEDLRARVPGVESERGMAAYLMALDRIEAALETYWREVTEGESAGNVNNGVSVNDTTVAVESARRWVPERPEEVHTGVKDSDLAEFAPVNTGKEGATAKGSDRLVGGSVDQAEGDIADLLGLQ